MGETNQYGPAASYGGASPPPSAERITSAFSVIHERPNKTLSEVALYGDRYAQKKAADYYLDAVKDYLKEWSDKLFAQITDLETAFYYLNNRPREVIMAKEPDPDNDEEEEITEEMVLLATLNRICRIDAALARIEELKKNIELWARMGGIDKYANHVSGTAPASFAQVIKMTEGSEDITFDAVKDNADFRQAYERLMRHDEELRRRGL